MNRADFIQAVQVEIENSSISRATIKAVLDGAGTVAMEVLDNLDTVDLFGPGTLKVVKRAARRGRNPQTGETLEIPAGWRVKFTVSKALKDALKR